jgi:hypothetical protein
MVLAALIVDLVFGALGLIPSQRPTTQDVFGSIQLDYKAVLNALGAVIFVGLFALTFHRGVTDPVCGMTIDRGTALQVRHDDSRSLEQPTSPSCTVCSPRPVRLSADCMRRARSAADAGRGDDRVSHAYFDTAFPTKFTGGLITS